MGAFLAAISLCACLACGADRERSACELAGGSTVRDILRELGIRRPVARRSSESLHTSVCRFVARGVNVSVTLDTAPEVRRRYFNRVTEQQVFNLHRRAFRPQAIEALGDQDAFGPAGAYWVAGYRQLFALDGERLLIVGFSVRGVGANRARAAAERLAREVLEQPLTGRKGGARTAALDLSLITPDDGALVRTARVTVLGTVSGDDVRVTVAGAPVQVRDGIFARQVGLSKGRNSIRVVASNRRERITETVRVKRGSSPRQIGEALARRGPTVVPDLLGERLGVAESILDHAGIRHRRVKLSTGRVLPGAWAVCQTRPGPGKRIPRSEAVVLLIDHSDIYRTSETACAQR